VSEIIKNRDVEEPKKRSREDWRKAKELEEARKAGNAPAAVDEDGKILTLICHNISHLHLGTLEQKLQL